MIIMKTLKITLIALFIVSSFAACKKDKKDSGIVKKNPGVVVPVSIEGKWTVKYDNSFPVPLHAATTLNIKPNGILGVTLYDNTIFAGAWKLDGNNFTANYPVDQPIFYFKGIFNIETGKFTEGTRGNSPEASMGKWDMTKVQ